MAVKKTKKPEVIQMAPLETVEAMMVLMRRYGVFRVVFGDLEIEMSTPQDPEVCN